MFIYRVFDNYYIAIHKGRIFYGESHIDALLTAIANS